MKIFGDGKLNDRGSNRLVWDFADGLLETSNFSIIEEAKRRGCVFGEQAEKASALVLKKARFKGVLK